MLPGLSIELDEPLAGVTELRVRGDVDLDGGKRLGRELEAAFAGGGPVLVNLCECSFMDSSGLSALIRAGRRNPDPRRFAVLCLREGDVRKVLALTRADTLLDVYEDRDAALATVSG
ncbi:MAG: hypothetical protein AVDCRST_MAG53-879 [uncultured Solirubrobacteraceae bacterium]|uniref:STAS domain-containing protein n=1 Tax=uncultured Solirubrobacteraceae bacterium TaxID=1162706 RepID=A0A6J4RVI8_9ACTN|nr:MAG: hypothetical protein AVDCRST_MAG53-879 [uncultured Solirubrobacteraceae bacterium]